VIAPRSLLALLDKPYKDVLIDGRVERSGGEDALLIHGRNGA
jgi:hypothetical protein